MKLTLSVRFLLHIIDILHAMGFSRKASLDIAGLNLDDMPDVKSRVSLDRIADIFNAAETYLDEPYVGLIAGYKFRIGNYAQTGNIYSYCRNIQQVIFTNAKYQQLAIDAGDISYDQELDPETGTIRHFMCFQPYDVDPIYYRHVIESILGSYGTAYRWLSWSSGENFVQIDLPYAAPNKDALHQRIYRGPIRYGQPHARFEFSETTMHHQLSTYDKDKFIRAEAQLTALLKSDDFNASLKGAVKMAMRDALREDKVGTHIVAKRMGKSWNVLRRELIEAGLSYRELLETVRKEAFHACLAEKRSFSDIAQELGYNDQAAFTKAFKRWYGVSPRQWKAAYQIGQTKP